VCKRAHAHSFCSSFQRVLPAVIINGTTIPYDLLQVKKDAAGECAHVCFCACLCAVRDQIDTAIMPTTTFNYSVATCIQAGSAAFVPVVHSHANVNGTLLS
jgi:hypothetical protein